MQILKTQCESITKKTNRSSVVYAFEVEAVAIVVLF